MSTTVKFVSYKPNTQFDEEECTNLYVEISEQIENRITKFDNTDDANILNECYNLEKYLDEQNESYEKCYEYPDMLYSLNIKKKITELLNQSTKYPKCSKESTQDEERDKLKFETNELCKGPPCDKKVISPEESNATTSSHTEKLTAAESPDPKRLSENNQQHHTGESSERGSERPESLQQILPNASGVTSDPPPGNNTHLSVSTLPGATAPQTLISAKKSIANGTVSSHSASLIEDRSDMSQESYQTDQYVLDKINMRGYIVNQYEIVDNGIDTNDPKFVTHFKLLYKPSKNPPYMISSEISNDRTYQFADNHQSVLSISTPVTALPSLELVSETGKPE
ncbi:hypothetical protein PVC01_140076900 [Plasmodium vivax]|uniref:Uncharacterized protein n=3 Tax=Plasmodium vivax TaxID=5855 RepID=A0A0J9T4L2_PLAVI|nr:hypothetical protein PVBG_00559 [Plasmodium vivax Brazil I]KMZ90059.1 hypothetical protein PVMG_03620 [Plasmodium vivax Mauritania I]CAG9472661.1 unnamed protein product [Plasmodium vivax]SCO75775.1 hypothetical protein PVC01_140076900 [Plasmodium vivax]